MICNMAICRILLMAITLLIVLIGLLFLEYMWTRELQEEEFRNKK